MDMPNDFPCILSCDWNFSPRAKTNMASNWPSCIIPCKNTGNDSWSCCSLIGHKKKQRFFDTNQKPERLRPFGTGPVRLCPQGLLVSFFTFLRRIFFIARYDFPSPPLSVPGSPRMTRQVPLVRNKFKAFNFRFRRLFQPF